MKNEITKDIAEAIKTIITTAEEQIPPAIEELLQWHFIYHVTWGVICFVFVMVFAILGLYFYKKGKGLASYSEPVHYYILSFISFVGNICFVLGLITNIMTAIQIYITPRAWIFDYIKQLNY